VEMVVTEQLLHSQVHLSHTLVVVEVVVSLQQILMEVLVVVEQEQEMTIQQLQEQPT
tara:strand:+ start:313 stop:483 length:171 start_codon:yes stop_codon:yes gene_type:complete